MSNPGPGPVSRPATLSQTDQGPAPSDDHVEEDALHKLARFLETWSPTRSRQIAPARAAGEQARPPVSADAEPRDDEPLELTPLRRARLVRTLPFVLGALAIIVMIGTVVALNRGAVRLGRISLLAPATYPPTTAPPGASDDGSAPAWKGAGPTRQEKGLVAPELFSSAPEAKIPPVAPARSLAAASEPPAPDRTNSLPIESMASHPGAEKTPPDQAVILLARPEPFAPETKAVKDSAAGAQSAPSPPTTQETDKQADAETLRATAIRLANAPLPPIRPSWLGKPAKRARTRRSVEAASEPRAPPAPPAPPALPGRPAAENSGALGNPLRLFGNVFH